MLLVLPMTDDLDALVERARAGEREAYDLLFARAADRLLLFVRLRLGAGLAARLEPTDVLQEVYLAAHAAFDSFEARGPGSFLAWLCGIAQNRLGRLAEHHRVRHADSAPISRVLDLARDDRTGPVTAACRVDSREQLAQAVEGLDEEAKQVLLLRFFEGLNQAEIAERTGRSTSAVQRSLAKALGQVGGHLS